MNLSLTPIIGLTLVFGLLVYRSKLSFRTSLYIYLLCHTATLAFWPYEQLINLMPHLKYNVRASHAQSLAYLLLIPMVMDKVYPTKLLWQFLAWAFVTDAVAILFGFPGITYGLSFDTSVIILLLPIFYRPTWIRRILTACALIAVVKVGGATSLVMATAMLTIYAVKSKNKILMTILLAGSSYLAVKAVLSSSSLSHGRFELWTPFMRWFIVNAYHLVGTGLGSFEWYAQFIYNDKSGAYTFLHNDLLQLLFETGIIGLVLGLGTIGETIWALRKNTQMLTVSVGLIIFMLFYSPTHIFAGMMITILLLVEARNERILRR
jgi:O-antigen ligase